MLGVPPAEVPGSLIRASLASYARYWREAFRLPSMDHQVLARQLDGAVEGGEHVAAALEAGRGAILALPHSGNWDMAGVWLTDTYGSFATVAERLKPESLYKRFVDYRESLGFEVLPLTGGDRPPFEVLAERLRDNGLVCLMSRPRPDRSPASRSTSSASRPACPPVRPSWRSHRRRAAAGAQLVRARRVGHRGVTRRSTRRPATSDVDHAGAGRPVRRRHRRAPADWHMLQPQWLADLSDERRARHHAASEASLMRIGMVCPYSFDVPGGVQAHVLQLAEVMRRLRPRRQRARPVVAAAPTLPDYVVSGGKAVPDSRTTGRSPGCASARPPTAR